MGAGAAYFEQNPYLKQRLEAIKTQDRSYLAHEYYNADWHPMPFSQAADQLSQAKLTFAASASIMDNLHGFSIPPAAHEILQSVRDPIMREATRDYFINQQFRRDIFVKGPRPIAPYDHAKRVERQRFILLGDPAKVPTKVTAGISEISLREDIYNPLAETLSAFPGGRRRSANSSRPARCPRSAAGRSGKRCWC